MKINNDARLSNRKVDRIEKIGQHSTQTYYRVTTGDDVQILAVMNRDNYTEDQIVEAYPNARIPYCGGDIDECFSNPLRIFDFIIYDTFSKLKSVNMSAWEYETIIKKEKKVNPILKMAFICQDNRDKTFHIDCESYDDKSRATKENMIIVDDWIYRSEEEISELIGKSREMGYVYLED